MASEVSATPPGWGAFWGGVPAEERGSAPLQATVLDPSGIPGGAWVGTVQSRGCNNPGFKSVWPLAKVRWPAWCRVWVGNPPRFPENTGCGWTTPEGRPGGGMGLCLRVPGGNLERSRWLSGATPPDRARPKGARSRQGSQRGVEDGWWRFLPSLWGGARFWGGGPAEERGSAPLQATVLDPSGIRGGT